VALELELEPVTIPKLDEELELAQEPELAMIPRLGAALALGSTTEREDSGSRTTEERFPTLAVVREPVMNPSLGEVPEELGSGLGVERAVVVVLVLVGLVVERRGQMGACGSSRLCAIESWLPGIRGGWSGRCRAYLGWFGASSLLKSGPSMHLEHHRLVVDRLERCSQFDPLSLVLLLIHMISNHLANWLVVEGLMVVVQSFLVAMELEHLVEVWLAVPSWRRLEVVAVVDAVVVAVIFRPCICYRDLEPCGRY
jgi:hypothetical protein